MSHEHRHNPERFYDDEGEAYEPFEWFDRPGKPAQGDEAQPWEMDGPYGWEATDAFHAHDDAGDR